MSRRKAPADGEDGYEVGYCKPPKHNQFQPGQSGHPSGRRKGVRNFKTELKRTLEMKVKVKENGRTRTKSTQAAALMVLREKALNGHIRALMILLNYALSLNNDEVGQTQPLPADDRPILDAFLKAYGMTSATGGSADDQVPKAGSGPRRKARK